MKEQETQTQSLIRAFFLKLFFGLHFHEILGKIYFEIVNFCECVVEK